MLTSRSFENGDKPALLRNYGKSPALLRKTLLVKSSLLKSLLRKPRLTDIEKTDRMPETIMPVTLQEHSTLPNRRISAAAA